MNKLFSAGAVALVVLCGCGKSNPSVNSDGTCTQQYIDDANAIIDAHVNAQVAESSQDVTNEISSLEKTKAACDKFTATHGGSVTCKASYQGQEVDVSTDKVKELCSNDSNVLTSLKNAQTTTGIVLSPIGNASLKSLSQ